MWRSASRFGRHRQWRAAHREPSPGGDGDGDVGGDIELGGPLLRLQEELGHLGGNPRHVRPRQGVLGDAAQRQRGERLRRVDGERIPEPAVHPPPHPLLRDGGRRGVDQRRPLVLARAPVHQLVPHRLLPGHQLQQHDAEREHVGAPRRRAARHELRRHVPARALDPPPPAAGAAVPARGGGGGAFGPSSVVVLVLDRELPGEVGRAEMRDLGAGEGPVAADEDGGRREAVVDGVGLEVDVVERVADVGGELEARVPGRERGEGRVLGVPEQHGERGRVGDELVGEEQRGAVGGRGGAEEARDGGVVAVAQHGEARGHVPRVAAERAAEDGGGVAAERAAEGVGGGRRGGDEAVRGGEVGGGGGQVLEGEEEGQLREGVAERGEGRCGGGRRGGGGSGVERHRREGGRGGARRPVVPRRGCGGRHGG